ncbi:hypothetical protein AGMMS49944_32220 [Spirochaetia bacterium]|nr:hypothetical protein AGMMS49944_32220 [Spirochaetia bacterium]
MKGIDKFLLDKMIAYHAGGLAYAEASAFTLGELRAIYQGNHWTNGKPTPAPEPITEADAMRQAAADAEELRGPYMATHEGGGGVSGDSP